MPDLVSGGRAALPPYAFSPAEVRGGRTACASGTATRGGLERVLELGQDLVARASDGEDVLEADPAPARTVDGRLDGQDHALVDPLLAPGNEERWLRPRGADAVPGVVPVRVAPGGERVADRPVHLPGAGGPAGPRQRGGGARPRARRRRRPWPCPPARRRTTATRP